MSDAQTLEELRAREQIRELVLAYCRAIDRKDFVLLRKLYHEGAGDEHGLNPSGTADEFFERLPGLMEPVQALHHSITNHAIKVEGDYAEGEAYVSAFHVVDLNGERYSFLQGARYLDKYERRDGVWKFAHRRVVTDWLQRYGVAPDVLENAPEIHGMRLGISGPDDPSHSYFRLFRRGEP